MHKELCCLGSTKSCILKVGLYNSKFILDYIVSTMNLVVGLSQKVS
jgi:hypothetical protein